MLNSEKVFSGTPGPEEKFYNIRLVSDDHPAEHKGNSKSMHPGVTKVIDTALNSHLLTDWLSCNANFSLSPQEVKWRH